MNSSAVRIRATTRCPIGIRSELIQSGQPALWNGLAVKRDVTRTVMTGGAAPGELTTTSDWVDLAGYAGSLRALRAADDRHARELEAEIGKLAFSHGERLADGLKIRNNAAGRGGFQIHSLAEIRLAGDAPMLQAIGAQYRNRPVLSVETEVLNLRAGRVDPAIFAVPAGFSEVDFNGLLEQKVYRHRH